MAGWPSPVLPSCGMPARRKEQARFLQKGFFALFTRNVFTLCFCSFRVTETGDLNS